jgi:hypothetical protein
MTQTWPMTLLLVSLVLVAGCHRASNHLAPGEACTYPTNGLGILEGDVVEKVTWQGYAENSDGPSTINIEDFHDCDGSKGINALLIDTSAIWCSPCQDAAVKIESEMKASWKAAGIHVITLIAQDAMTAPAKLSDANIWRADFNLYNTVVAADPFFTFAPPDEKTIGLPLELVVDPRTMTIIDAQEGFTGDYSTLTDLAADNKPD